MFPDMHELLACVGLPSASHEAMEQRAIELAPFGEYEGRDDGGSRIVWRDASGAGLSILSDGDHVLQCIIPFFSSPPRARALVRQVVEDRGSRFSDRVVVDVLNLRGEHVFRAALLVHDLASSRQLLNYEREMELGLTLFLERHAVVGSDTALRVDPHPSVVDQPGLPEPRVKMVARVLSVETRINRASGAPFLHLKLDVNGLPIDAVARMDGLTTDDHGLSRGDLLSTDVVLVGALEPGRNDTTIPRMPGSR